MMLGALVVALTVPLTGPPVDQLKLGVNLSGWFSYPSRRTAAHFRGYIGATDAVLLKSAGVTHVRIPIEPSVIADNNGWKLKKEVWKFVIEGARTMQRNGLAVVLDLHPSETTVAEPTGSPESAQSFLVLWDQICDNLTGLDQRALWLEPCNEPNKIGSDAWNDLQAKAVSRIRKKQPYVPLILTGANWGGVDGLVKVRRVADSNVVYSFHFYEPHMFTHQGAPWGIKVRQEMRSIPYPSPTQGQGSAVLLSTDAQREFQQYVSEGWKREKVFQRVRLAADWAKRHGVRLYCGEFGVFARTAPEKDRINWYRDTIEALNASRIPVCFWDYLGQKAFGIADGEVGKRSFNPFFDHIRGYLRR